MACMAQCMLVCCQSEQNHNKLAGFICFFLAATRLLGKYIEAGFGLVCVADECAEGRGQAHVACRILAGIRCALVMKLSQHATY